MNLRQLVSSASLAAMSACFMAASASAGTVTFNTNAPGTGFGGVSLIQNNLSGVAATLTFIPDADTVTGTPSNVNLGNFTLVCATCTTQALGTGSTFGAFTFNLVITDVTDTGMGTFVGTSAGGTVYSDVSDIAIAWSPLMLGPGTNNASAGTFGQTIFTTTVFTGIVAPNSGAVPGQSTVQGFVSSPTPEPSTWALLGGSLIGLSILRRKLSA